MKLLTILATILTFPFFAFGKEKCTVPASALPAIENAVTNGLVKMMTSHAIREGKQYSDQDVINLRLILTEAYYDAEITKHCSN